MKLADKAINFVMRTCGVPAQHAGKETLMLYIEKSQSKENFPETTSIDLPNLEKSVIILL